MGFEEKEEVLQKSAGHTNEESRMSQQEQLSPCLTSGLMFAQEGSRIMTVKR